LRSLAERFHEPSYKLIYERSALQSGDIYTKGFTNAADWERAVKLINHLDPVLFWQGQDGSSKSLMPSEHKGGVKYDYWTSNPWCVNDKQSLDNLTEETTTVPSVATAFQTTQGRPSMPVTRLRSPEDPVEGSMPVKRLSLPVYDVPTTCNFDEHEYDYFNDAETAYDSDDYCSSEGSISDNEGDA